MNIEMAGPSITDVEINAVMECMKSGWSGYGYVEKFEREYAAYHNRKYALMTPNCTSAIHLLLLGLGIGHGDEVIVPECTWIASAAPISYVGASPVFCDIDEETWCLSPARVERLVTKQTKAIIAVDLFGNMPDMTALEKLAMDKDIFLIEDAAEAVGSVYEGRRAGGFGTGSVFSFHRTKTICTGEGGILLIDDQALFEKCRIYRDHGRGPNTRPYFNEAVTPKYMPFNLQAAMACAQFSRIDELVAKKRAMLLRYKSHLAGLGTLSLNPEPPNGVNGAWITAVVFHKETGITKLDAMRRLKELGVPSRPFFYPLTSIPAYPGREEIGKNNARVAYDISSRGINLPCGFSVTDDQIDFVCEQVIKIL